MLDWFRTIDPIGQGLLGGLFTWSVTALGAGLVLVTRRLPAGLLDVMLGFAAGVMIAASVWSLLLPAIDLAEELGYPAWLPAAVGFLAGGLFLRVVDQLLPHLHPGLAVSSAEGVRTGWQRATLL
ncbi:MAG: ZIP family metal transporter, partial [Vicinamibacteraceae bacterium]